MDPLATLDPDLGHKRSHQRLPRRLIAVADGLRDLGVQRLDVLRCQWRVSVLFVGRQLLAAAFEAAASAAERFDSLAALLLGHRAVLERGEVAVERGIGSGDLGVELRPLGFEGRAVCVEFGGGFVDRRLHEVGAPQERHELVEHCPFERGRRDALGVAGGSAVAMAAEADVVAVATAVAVGGGADVALAAAVAAKQPAEEVVGLVGAAQLGVVAALVHHLLCAVECAEVDQRLCGPA